MPKYKQDGGLIALNKAFGDYASSVSNLSGSLNSAADKLNQIQAPKMNNYMQSSAGPHIKFPFRQPGGFFGGLTSDIKSGLAGGIFNRGLQAFENGGEVYAQDGQLIPPGQPEVPLGPEANIPTEQPIPATGGAPMMPEAMPPQQPPMSAPMPMPKKSFAEKVAEAKMVIEKNKGEGMPLPTPAPMPTEPFQLPGEPMMTDAEGDGGVLGDVTYSDEPVGPDIGPDVVDAKLTPGEFVLNKEATEMYRPQIEQMNQDGLIAREMGGSVPYYDDGGYVDKLNYLMENDPDNAAHWNAIKTSYFQDGGPSFKEQYIQPHLDSGAIGQLGKSLVHIGQGDFTGASDALQPTKLDNTAQKELKSKQQRATAYKESIDAASLAKQYVDAGADVILNYKAKSWSQLLEESGFDVNSLIGFGASQISGERNNAINTVLHNKFGGTSNWNAYQLYEHQIKLLQLKARSLVKGGSISDSEAAAAAATIVTGTADATTIKQQLDTVMDRNNAGLTDLGQEAYISDKIGHQVSGKVYEANEGVGLKGTSVTPDTIEEGQKFTSTGATGTYEYNTVSKNGEAYVVTSTGEYKLNYDATRKEWYIEGLTGKTILTPM